MFVAVKVSKKCGMTCEHDHDRTPERRFRPVVPKRSDDVIEKEDSNHDPEKSTFRKRPTGCEIESCHAQGDSKILTPGIRVLSGARILILVAHQSLLPSTRALRA